MARTKLSIPLVDSHLSQLGLSLVDTRSYNSHRFLVMDSTRVPLKGFRVLDDVLQWCQYRQQQAQLFR
jgi:hypothetical protein